MNQRVLQMIELAGGMKGAGVTTGIEVLFPEAASWCKICVSSKTVVVPESGLSVL